MPHTQPSSTPMPRFVHDFHSEWQQRIRAVLYHHGVAMPEGAIRSEKTRAMLASGELELSSANFTVLERANLGNLLREISLAYNLGDVEKARKTMQVGKLRTTKWIVKFDILKAEQIAENWLAELVTDKGYHSNGTMVDLKEFEIRSYVSEPKRGRRNWIGKQAERDAVYANRRRIQGERGKKLLVPV